MELNKIVQGVNHLLAGELLTLNQLKSHLDATIDDINNRLNATFPTITEFVDGKTGLDYNAFPDRYIRSVLFQGAAFYFYLTDEEGAESAPEYMRVYQKNIFYMERDYTSQVPEKYQAGDKGSLSTPTVYGIPAFYDDVF
jgi:hypothetical protein